MRKPINSKLRLSKDTLRILSSTQLGDAAGGMRPVTKTSCEPSIAASCGCSA